MANTAFMMGERLRLTRVNRCGKPIEGAANTLVTDGWIRAQFTPNMKAANDLEQENAAGKVCAKGRTKPVRKWWDVELQICGVDPDLYSLLTSWERVLDYDDRPIGFRDSPDVEAEYGVALEIWAGQGSEADCPIPTTDDVFSVQSSGASNWYLLAAFVEWQIGQFPIGAEVTNFTFSGISIPMPEWGRGPYNVAAIDQALTAGRLLTATGKREHLTVFSTPIAPPKPTDGAVPLDITGLFVAPDYYFGGDAGEPAADVAPTQVAVDQGYELTITGTPTGGNFTLELEYPDQPDRPTGNILFNSTPAQAKTVLGAVDDGYPEAAWTVTGTNLPGGTILIVPPAGVVVKTNTSALTGGTSPTVHVDEA